MMLAGAGSNPAEQNCRCLMRLSELVTLIVDRSGLNIHIKFSASWRNCKRKLRDLGERSFRAEQIITGSTKNASIDRPIVDRAKFAKNRVRRPLIRHEFFFTSYGSAG